MSFFLLFLIDNEEIESQPGKLLGQKRYCARTPEAVEQMREVDTSVKSKLTLGSSIMSTYSCGSSNR